MTRLEVLQGLLEGKVISDGTMNLKLDEDKLVGFLEGVFGGTGSMDSGFIEGDFYKHPFEIVESPSEFIKEMLVEAANHPNNVDSDTGFKDIITAEIAKLESKKEECTGNCANCTHCEH